MHFRLRRFQEWHLSITVLTVIAIAILFNIRLVSAQTPVTLDVQVSSSTDDAYHSPSGWPNFSSNSVALYVGSPSGRLVWDGFRWSGLNIPADATIVDAYAEFNQTGWGSIFPTTLAFENSPAPAPFSAGSSPFHRWSNRTTFEGIWTWDKGLPGSWVRSPSLTAGIQELVDTHGAISQIVLIEDGTGTPVNPTTCGLPSMPIHSSPPSCTSSTHRGLTSLLL